MIVAPKNIKKLSQSNLLKIILCPWCYIECYIECYIMKWHLFAFQPMNEIEADMLDFLQNLNSKNSMKPLKFFANYSTISQLAKTFFSPEIATCARVVSFFHRYSPPVYLVKYSKYLHSDVKSGTVCDFHNLGIIEKIPNGAAQKGPAE